MMSEAMEELTTTTTNRSILRFVKLLVLTFIVCHWFTCMWVRVRLAIGIHSAIAIDTDKLPFTSPSS